MRTRLRSELFFELELNKENDINTEGCFVDLSIKIEDNRFFIRLSDKRDDFPFSIVRMPYLRRNISCDIFYSAFGAEILRIARTTSTCNEFRTSCKVLVNTVQNQGGNAVIL